MKKYFPLYMDMTDKKVVVIGGGKIAARRVNILLGFVDKIIVVSPELGMDLEKLIFEKCEEGILWMQDYYKKDYIEDADMVLACTDIKVINDIIQRDCQRLELESKKRIYFNRCDDKSQCDFFFPSIVEKDGIVIGINSGGESPAKTKEVRKKMEELFECGSSY